MCCCRSCGRKASSNRNLRSPEKFKSRHPEGPRDLNKVLGNDLLSRRVTPAVPSALEGLTSVFGKGTGVSPPPLSPNDGDYTEPLGEESSAYRVRRRRARRLLIFLASAGGT